MQTHVRKIWNHTIACTFVRNEQRSLLTKNWKLDNGQE